MVDLTKFDEPETGQIYYRYREPTPVDYSKLDKVGVVYKGFLISCNPQFMIYWVRTVDDKEPPLSLQSGFTSEREAREGIDAFLRAEILNQKAADKVRSKTA